MRKITFLTIGDISKIATMKRALGMANPLHKLGWDVSIIALDCEENRKRIAMECDSTIMISYYKATSTLNESRDKTMIINQIKPDFVYLCSYSIRNRIIKKLLTCKPKLLVEYSELQSSMKRVAKVKRLMYYFLEIKSIFYTDRLICASQYLYNYFKVKSTFLGKGKLPVLYSPYGFNNEIINYPKKILPGLKEKYNKKTVIVYMGTMAKNYGLFTMLEAMLILLKRNNSEVKLLLLGTGRDTEEAKKFVSTNNLNNHVEFLGYVPEDDLISYLELANMFISPLNDTVQDWARCPSKIYMYLPFNKPVLTCKIGEAKEIFKEDGYYFDNSNPESLSNLIEKTMENPNIHLQVDISHHTWSKRAEELNNWIVEKFV